MDEKKEEGRREREKREREVQKVTDELEGEHGITHANKEEKNGSGNSYSSKPLGGIRYKFRKIELDRSRKTEEEEGTGKEEEGDGENGREGPTEEEGRGEKRREESRLKHQYEDKEAEGRESEGSHTLDDSVMKMGSNGLNDTRAPSVEPKGPFWMLDPEC